MKKYYSRWVCIGLLVLLVASQIPLWCGCATGLRRYSGRVVNADTGEPLCGIRIEATFFVRGDWCPHLEGLFIREPVVVVCETGYEGKFSLRSRKNQLPFHVYGPRGAHMEWRVDEKNPESIIIPMKLEVGQWRVDEKNPKTSLTPRNSE